MPPVRIFVCCAPPAKDPGLSILNPEHPQYCRVQALRRAMEHAMVGAEPFGGANVRMDVRYRRGHSTSDGLNIINGIADVIQCRCYWRYRYHVWVIDDDESIREFHYTEEPSQVDQYEVVISALP